MGAGHEGQICPSGVHAEQSPDSTRTRPFRIQYASIPSSALGSIPSLRLSSIELSGCSVFFINCSNL